MRKTIFKIIKGNTKYWKHESKSRVMTFFETQKTPRRFRDRSYKRCCQEGRGCDYCINGRLHSSNKNIERADEMLHENKTIEKT